MTLFQESPPLQRPVAHPLQLADVEPATPRPPRPPAPAPLLPVAIGVILGIVLDFEISPPQWASLSLVAIGAAAVLLKGRRTSVRFIALTVCAAGLGAIRHDLAFRRFASNHIVHYTQPEPILAKLRARVLSDPEVIEPDSSRPHAFEQSPKTRFIMEAMQVGGMDGPIAVSGKVAMSVKAPLLLLKVGDLIEMTGWLFRPRGPQNPGAFDWALSMRRAGIMAGMSCEHAESVQIIARAPPGWQGILAKARTYLNGYLLHGAFDDDDPGAGVIEAMVLGQRGAVSKAMNDAFVRTGNAHFLAASGMNVAWLALTGWGVMRLLGVYYRTTAVVVGLLILSYVLLAQPEPSILRAGIVGLLGCLALFVRGRASALNWLACSAIIVLMIDPCDLFRAGFQLSFIGVLAVMHLSKVVREGAGAIMSNYTPRFVSDRRLSVSDSYAGTLISKEQSWRSFAQHGLINASSTSVSVGLACWIATVPLTCYTFGQFAPWGFLSTIILLPFAFIATLVGYLKVLIALIFPSSAIVFGPLLNWTTSLITGVVSFLARLPGTLIDGRSPSLAWVLACYALILWRTYFFRKGFGMPATTSELHSESAMSADSAQIPYSRFRIPHFLHSVSARVRRHAFKFLTLSLVLWWLIPPRWFTLDRHALQVWMLAVGDGTCNVIELPSGQVMVCDLGTRSTLDASAQAASFLKWRGIRRIDTVFVSHADFDHYSGIEGLAREFDIKRLVINDHFQPYLREPSSAAHFLNAIRELHIPVEVRSGNFNLTNMSGVTVESIWPPRYAQRTLPDTNDRSTVLRLSFEGKSILLPGDIASPAMAGLLDHANLKADVLALPHHGSVVSNTARFIEAVDPAACVRSTGQRRSMTVNGIESAVGSRKYFSTVDDGCVRARIADGAISVEAVMNRR